MISQPEQEKRNMNQNQDAMHISLSLRLIILTALVSGLCLTLYQDAIANLFGAIIHREYSSHGVFVPILSAYLVWIKRSEIKDVPFHFSLIPGAVILTLAFTMLYIAKGTQEVALPALSFFVAVFGLLVCLLGVPLFQKILSPLLFLLTMIPLPHFAYIQIADYLRTASTATSTWLVLLTGIPIYREGFHIRLPDYDLFIGISCSGSRYLLSYFSFGLYYAMLFKNSLLARTTVVLASLPLAFLANVLRLFLLYLSTFLFGTFFLSSWPHILLGWLIFACGIILGVSLDKLIGKFNRSQSAQNSQENHLDKLPIASHFSGNSVCAQMGRWLIG
jgi:exosortase